MNLILHENKVYVCSISGEAMEKMARTLTKLQSSVAFWGGANTRAATGQSQLLTKRSSRIFGV
mgnify:CR=1 FL=1